MCVDADAERPGDYEAMMLLRYFTNNSITPDEYLTASPRLFEDAVKKEGGKDAGFDGDFLVMARFLNAAEEKKRGKILAYMRPEQRIALLSNVYGKLEFMKQTFWWDPRLTEHKKGYIEHAEKSLKKWEIWTNVFAERALSRE